MNINYDLTVKNWKFWVVLPVALLLLLVASIPKGIIILLEFTIACVEFVNFGDKHSKYGRRILNWVHRA